MVARMLVALAVAVPLLTAACVGGDPVGITCDRVPDSMTVVPDSLSARSDTLTVTMCARLVTPDPTDP